MRVVRVVFMVFCGIVGGWAGYWMGHLAGWSVNADWPARIGGGTGAILLSIGLAVLGVAFAGLVLVVLPHLTARRLLRGGVVAEAAVLDVKRTGLEASRRRGVHESQVCCRLEVRPQGGAPFQARATQFMSQSDESALRPGAVVSVRYDPGRPSRVAIERVPIV